MMRNNSGSTTTSGLVSPLLAKPFLAYLSASSLWLAGVTISSFLGSWLLIDRVGASPEQTGWANTASRLLPLLFLLAGGALIDRNNNRSYLIVMHILIILPGLGLVAWLSLPGPIPLSYGAVVGFMVSMAAIQDLCSPARQAALTRVAPTDIQRSVTLIALVGSVVAFLAVTVGGMIDQLGDNAVLLIMCGLFVVSLWPVLALPNLPPQTTKAHPPPIWREILAGAHATWHHRVLRPVILCNFASSMFNAGAYSVAIPFIAKTVYAGGATTFASALGAITFGAGVSSLLLLVAMPFARPGRVFLAFQLTRAAILLGLWINMGEWAFYGLMGLWGVNMGVTSTLGRSLVQAEAPDAVRGKVFALMLLSFILASAIGAPVLGALVGAADPLTALLPGVAISILIFGFGRLTPLWSYQDPQAH